jgi:hypothetical protein
MIKFYKISTKICLITTVLSIVFIILKYLETNTNIEKLNITELYFKWSSYDLDAREYYVNFYVNSQIRELKELKEMLIILFFLSILVMLNLFFIVKNKLYSKSKIGSFNRDYLILVPLNTDENNYILKKILSILFTPFMILNILSIIISPFLFAIFFFLKNKINYEILLSPYAVSSFFIIIMWSIWVIISLVNWILKKPEIV